MPDHRNTVAQGMFEDNITRLTAKRATASVIEIIQGKTTVAEASRSVDLLPFAIKLWVEDASRGMENSRRVNLRDSRARYEKHPNSRRKTCGNGVLEPRARKS